MEDAEEGNVGDDDEVGLVAVRTAQLLREEELLRHLAQCYETFSVRDLRVFVLSYSV